MRPRTVLSLVLLALALCAGVASAQLPPQSPDPAIADGTRQHGLDHARELWKAKGPRSYRFELRRQCFCVPGKGVTVVVRGDRIATYPPGLKSVASVPRLFRAIQQAIDDEVVQLDVSYGTRGVPTKIYVDRSKYIADEETGYTTKRFTPLKRHAG
jgi:hypothetical protein